MSRIIALLLIVVVWMSWSKGLAAGETHGLSAPAALAVFLGGYAAMVIGLRGWAVLVSRRAMAGFSRGAFRFQQVMYFARLLVPAWLGVGIYVLNWGRIVQHALPWLYRWPSREMHLEFPQAVVGTMPALLAWVGLWWSHFPTEQLLREQSVMVNLEDDLPVHAPPTFWATATANFRMQVLFTLAPVIFILVLRDLTVMAFAAAGVVNARGGEDMIMLPATVLVFLMAPELLRRVLKTEPLPDSPLRRKLEQMSRDAKLKYRDILLWQTDCTMGNALVMGLNWRVRYVLLSDLLLETMTDQQIEAVFAHELGHVVHKHLIWFGVYAIAAMLFMSGPGDQLMVHLHDWYVRRHSQGSWEQIEGLVEAVIGFGSFMLAFGYLSPRFERQADVFAARTLQRTAEETGVFVAHADADPGNPATAFEGHGLAKVPVAVAAAPDLSPSYVGEMGAEMFASALHRVAVINHIPVTAGNWSHGSIAQRMRALREMSADPAHTGRFDRVMTRLYAGLLACLCLFGVWTLLLAARDDGSAAGAVVGTPQVRVGR